MPSDDGQGRPIELLLLDIGGVVLTDAMPAVFDDIAADRGPALAAFHRQHLRSGLWSGQMPEPHYWDAIAAFLGTDDQARWRELLLARLQPLVEAAMFRDWAQRIPIWLLSNHRIEWVYPALQRAALERYVARWFVSSEQGVLKPEAAAFQTVLRSWPAAPSTILFVDDREINVEVARGLGMQVLHAERGGRWLEQVSQRLRTCSGSINHLA